MKIPNGKFFSTSLLLSALLIASLSAFADPVTITNQPKNLTVLDGAPYVLSVGTDGTAPVTCMWFRDGVRIEGASMPRYAMPYATMKDNGAKFYVIVSNESDGKSASVTSSTVTLHVTTPALALKHRYSFEKDVSDSVGHADGMLMGAASISDGQLHLDGTRGTFANLPGGLIAGFDAVTFEFWASLGTNRSWCRVFDQGVTNGSSGEHDLYFCPHSGNRDFRLTIMDPNLHEKQARVRGNLDNTTNIQVVCVLDPSSGFQGIYTNGVLAGSTNILNSLGSVGTNYFFLGKSLFAGDAPLNGSIDEFRIYNTALTAEVIAADYKNGPNAVIKP